MKKQRGMALYVLIIAVVLVLMLIIASVFAIKEKKEENNEKQATFPYGVYYEAVDDEFKKGMVIFDNGVCQSILDLKSYNLIGTDATLYTTQNEHTIDEVSLDGVADSTIEKKDYKVLGAVTDIGMVTIKESKILLDGQDWGTISNDFETITIDGEFFRKTNIIYTYCEHEWEEMDEEKLKEHCHKCINCEILDFHDDDNEDEICDKCMITMVDE